MTSRPAGRAVTVWTVAAYVYGLAVVFGLAHFLYDIPIQLTDSYGNMLKLDTTWTELLRNELTARGYLRPLLFAELKAVYDLSGGNYFPWFRGVHVAQVLALVLFFLALVRPRTRRDLILVPLGLAVLVGVHTFRGTVVEAFPVNTFMTVLLCCLAAAVIALGERRWWTDAAAVLLFLVAALTVETGLLVWVVLIGAALVGARAVSRPALAVVSVLFAGYFVLRFVVLDVGAPALIERSSGFGFAILDPGELAALFGDRPLPFYAYNVAASASSVLFAEPRGGVFRLTQAIVEDRATPGLWINVTTSVLATMLIAVFVWQRRRRVRTWSFDRDDRLVLLFVMVVAANAVISYPYTKDVVMSPSGAFLAVAVFAATRSVTWPTSRGMTIAVSAAALVLASGWSIRAIGTHVQLREHAFKIRNDWAYADHWFAQQSEAVRLDGQRPLKRVLQRDAIYGHDVPPELTLSSIPVFDLE
jgi:hypothetical protein